MFRFIVKNFAVYFIVSLVLSILFDLVVGNPWELTETILKSLGFSVVMTGIQAYREKTNN